MVSWVLVVSFSTMLGPSPTAPAVDPDLSISKSLAAVVADEPETTFAATEPLTPFAVRPAPLAGAVTVTPPFRELPAPLTVMGLLNVCVPVHVGEMDCDNGGDASERIAVAADPLTADSPTDALGFANPLKLPGRSAAAMDRSPTLPVSPFGVARNWFAV